MRITEHIYLVGSGRLGFALSDMLDCNVYLVDCGDELVLIDSGAGRDIETILDVVRADGLDPAEIRHILLTHAHADHAGGCAPFGERLDVTVWGDPTAARWVRDGDEGAISLHQAREAGIYPADYHFRGCAVDGTVRAGEPLHFGSVEFLPIATPGHADGHIAYQVRLDERHNLFVGDLVLCGGQVLLQYTHDCSLQRLGDSLLRLAEIEVDALFPGHLHFCLRDGLTHVEAAASRLRRMLVPQSIA